MAAQAQQETALDSDHDSSRDQEISVEQEHLDRVYRRLEEKIHEAEFLMHDAAKRGHVGTPGALAERDAQVFRAGVHLNRLNNEFEDFLFGRIDLLPGKDGKKGPDGAYTAIEPADGAVRDDNTADIAETLHIGRIGVLDSEYAPSSSTGGPPRPRRSTAPPPSTRAGSCAGASSAPRAAGSSVSRTT